MVSLKIIVKRIRNVILRSVGLRPAWWKRSTDDISKPLSSQTEAPLNGEAIHLQTNSSRPKVLSKLEYAVLTQAPFQPTPLEQATRKASKVSFNRSSAYAEVSQKVKGISVNGGAYPLPAGVIKVRDIYLLSNNS